MKAASPRVRFCALAALALGACIESPLREDCDSVATYRAAFSYDWGSCPEYDAKACTWRFGADTERAHCEAEVRLSCTWGDGKGIVFWTQDGATADGNVFLDGCAYSVRMERVK